jgi:hypothetical protein
LLGIASLRAGLPLGTASGLALLVSALEEETAFIA